MIKSILFHRPFSFKKIKFLQTQFLYSTKCKLCTYNSAVHSEISDSYDSTQSKNTETESVTGSPFYRQYLENNSLLYPTVFKPSPLMDLSKYEIYKLFKILQDDPNKIDVIKNYGPYIEKELSSMTFDEFTHCLYEFAKCSVCRKCKDPHWLNLLSSIDKICFSKVDSYGKTEAFILAHLLHMSAFYLKFDFIWKVVFRSCHKSYSLTEEQIIHTFYLLTKFTRVPSQDNKFTLQNMANNIIKKLNLHEIGLISFSITKIKLKIVKDIDLIPNLMETVLLNIENLRDSQILKDVSRLMNQSKSQAVHQAVVQLQESIIPYVDRFSSNSLVDLLLSGMYNDYLNIDLFQKVSKLLISNLEDVSNQNLPRLVFLYAKFNVRFDDLLKHIKEECLARNIPSCLVTVALLRNFIYLGDFDQKLFDTFLSAELLTKAAKTSAALVCNLKFIMDSIAIEMPDYQGPKPNPKLDSKFFMVLRAYSGAKTSFGKSLAIGNMLTYKLSRLLQNAYGEEYFIWKMVLEHHIGYNIMRFNENLEVTPIPAEFKERPKEKVIKAPDDGHIWVVFYFAYPSSFGHDSKLNYIIRTDLTQLLSSGYLPVLIQLNELGKNKHDIKTYIDDLMQNRTQNSVHTEFRREVINPPL